MANRLALVVDDSKTARVTLKRMLQKYDLDVDTLESAQQALDYLVENTPDVIFMDHMMPGMDGLEAVEAIKGNPETATIPIMMYTSKEGDLYVSQARALGAIGILPKQVEPAELFQVLNKLGLVKDRRKEQRPGENHFVLVENAPELALSAATEDMQEIARKAAASVSNNSELHNYIGGMLADHQQAIRTDIHDVRHELEHLTESLSNPARGNTGLIVPLIVVLLMLIPLLWLLNINNNTRAALDSANSRVDRMQAAQVQQQLASAETGDDASAEESPGSQGDLGDEHTSLLYDSITWAINQSSPYDVREEAYSDRRLAIVHELVSRLDALGFRGVVQLESHLGEYCLAGNDASGYILAPADMAVTECSMIGHPLQELPTLGERQSIAFANFLATSPLLRNGDIRIEPVPYLYSRPRVAYPPRHADVTAYEWNRIAAANNRIDVTLVPTGQQ
jgi:CheY-like chemotaxis protein